MRQTVLSSLVAMLTAACVVTMTTGQLVDQGLVTGAKGPDIVTVRQFAKENNVFNK